VSLLRTRQEQTQTNSDINTGVLESTPTSDVDSIMLSYSKLPKNEISAHHTKHFFAARNVLWGAINTFNSEMSDALNQPRISQYKLQQANDSFYEVVDKARSLNFPAGALKPMCIEFIDVSLDHERSLAPHLRKAVADMGLAIGDIDLLDTKVRHIASHHHRTIATAQNKALSETQLSSVAMAENMLIDLGVTISVEQIPSVATNIAEFTKARAKGAALTGAAALISTTVLAPSVVQATEAPARNLAVSVGTSGQASGSKLVVGIPTNETQAPSTISISTPVEAPTSNFIDAGIAMSPNIETDKQPAVPISVAPDTSVIEATIPTPVTVNVELEAPEESAVIITTPPSEAEIHAKAETILNTDNVGIPEAPQAVDGEIAPTDPIAIITEKETDTPKLDEETATPEQLAIQTIIDTIHTDGDISTAASLLRLNFHSKDQIATSYQNGEPVYEATNPELVNNIRGLEVAYENLIAAHGHADVNYVNTTLMALAVFDAAANDQTILSSPDVQQLLGGVKRPDDAYLGKLYDQYAGKAKEALTANDSALLKGVNEQYRAQVETMYTYILLASISDTEQGAQIQAIKDAEAAAAAAEAAKGVYASSPEAEAMKNLIDREQDPAKKRTFMAFNYLMANAGINATQAAGIIGNMLVESASTMDPSIKQYGGGPGRGMVQWEGGRFIALQNFAAAQGKTWDDFDVQMAFLISELPGRQKTLETIKGTTTLYDATREFMVRFETPKVVVDALKTKNWSKADAQAQVRADRAAPILDAYNAEVKAVVDARAAAEAARAAAEAERLARMGMNLDQAIGFVANYKNSADSINYIGGSGRDCKGGPLSNCVSFSVYFINKYTSIGGMGGGTAPGNGSTVVRNVKARNPSLETGHVPRPNAIFSTASGSQMCGDVKCGHTGVILGVDTDRGKVIVGEAGCNSTPNDWDTAREYDLAKFNSEKYIYVYTDGLLTRALN
jgi:hypothetical protein